MIYNADLNEGFFNSFFYLNKYYELGSLKDYMKRNFFNVKWNEKLNILKSIVKGLNHIHNQKIIHRDFHSGNILCDNETGPVISDLGISKSSIKSTNDDDEIYGIISYMAPEILRGKEYTTASDIYSFGMIMWELMTGRMPFWDQKNDVEFTIKICKGFRPPIVTNAPKGYIELMQECWNSDPNKRPTANYISDIFDEKIIPNYNNEIEISEISKSSDIGPIAVNNSNKSKTLKFVNSARSSEYQSNILESGK